MNGDQGGPRRRGAEDIPDDEDMFADLPTTPHPAAEPGWAPGLAGPADAAAAPASASGTMAGSGTAASASGWGGSQAPAVEDLLRQAVDTVASARRAPLSSSVLVARDDLVETLQRALEVLPDELRQARWLLREREEFLAQRQREADELIDTVRAQAERMVQRTEIVRQASQVAQRLVEDARDEARRLRHEAEDFCDKKLASFEVVLERTARTVRAGRERLTMPSAPGDQGSRSPGGGQGPTRARAGVAVDRPGVVRTAPATARAGDPVARQSAPGGGVPGGGVPVPSLSGLGVSSTTAADEPAVVEAAAAGTAGGALFDQDGP